MTAIRELVGDGSIHRLVVGRKVEHVITNGHILVIKLDNGMELQVGWANDNGELIKGKPVIKSCGLNVRAKTASMFGTAKQG